MLGPTTRRRDFGVAASPAIVSICLGANGGIVKTTNAGHVQAVFVGQSVSFDRAIAVAPRTDVVTRARGKATR
jgi:hypothetical protein